VREGRRRQPGDKWAVNIATAAQFREREGHLTVLGKHIEVLDDGQAVKLGIRWT
jgi:hypothetical protein